MILEIDTNLISKIGDISINQLVFLTLVLDENQKEYQDISELTSQVNENEIQELIDRNLVTVELNDNAKYYNKTKELEELTIAKKTIFDQFFELYPIYILRPDGSKDYLRSNLNKCRLQYNKIVGRSKAKHEHIMKCLSYEISERTRTGKISYMKRMWNWLTSCEWEVYEEQMKDNLQKNTKSYGTEIV